MFVFIFIFVTLIIVVTLFCFTLVLRNVLLFLLWFWAAVSRVKDRDIGRLANRFEIELF